MKIILTQLMILCKKINSSKRYSQYQSSKLSMVGFSRCDIKYSDDAWAFEVFNGHMHANNEGSLYSLSTEEIWDEVLSSVEAYLWSS